MEALSEPVRRYPCYDTSFIWGLLSNPNQIPLSFPLHLYLISVCGQYCISMDEQFNFRTCWTFFDKGTQMLLFVWDLRFRNFKVLFYLTQSKIKDTCLSQSVSKILMVWRLKKVYFCPYVWIAVIHSFPTIYIMGGFVLSKWVKIAIFSKKVPKKQRFWVSRFWITWLWRGETPKFFEVSATFAGVLKNMGHKL